MNETLDFSSLIGQRERDGGMAHWSKALDIAGSSELAARFRVHERQIAERYQTLDRLQIMQRPFISMPIADFLLKGPDALSVFREQGEEILFPFIQPRRYDPSVPEIRLVKMTHGELREAARQLHASYPAVDYVVTAVPFRKVLYNANVTVNVEGSVYAEFSNPDQLPSRAGTTVRFTAEKPHLAHGFRYSTEDETNRRIAYFAVRSLPKDSEGAPLPGYYELGIGRHPHTHAMEALFFDALPVSYLGATA